MIGAAGFGYAFNSLEAAAERRESESELARAFAVIFATARKFRVMTVLQVWFPVLRNFVSGPCPGERFGAVLTGEAEDGERGHAAGDGDDAQDRDGAH